MAKISVWSLEPRNPGARVGNPRGVFGARILEEAAVVLDRARRFA